MFLPSEDARDPVVQRVPSTGIGEVHLLGPPGCGKTHRLTHELIPAAVAAFGADAIMIVSMTKAGAGEIAGRQTVRIDRERVRTLHSLCYSIVKEHHGEQTVISLEGGGAAAKAWNDAEDGAGHHPTWRFPVVGEEDHFGFGEDARGACVLLADLDYTRSHMAPPTPEAEGFAKTYAEYKRARGLVDFTDMIEIVQREQLPMPIVNGSSVAVLFVDEAQDLSILEFTLVRQWLDEGLEILLLAGDADQAIYEFRGALPAEFHDPETWEGRTIELNQSYRVPALVAEYAERWHWAHDPKRVGVEYAPRVSPRGGEVIRSHLSITSGTQFADMVRREIQTLDTLDLKDAHRDVMVIAATSRLTRYALYALDDAGIRYHNPYAPTKFEWNPSGHTSAAITALVTGPSDPTAPRLWTWSEFLAWTAPCPVKGVLKRGVRAAMTRMSGDELREVMTESDVRASLVPSGYALTTLLCDLADNQLEGPLVWYRTLLNEKRRTSMERALVRIEKHGLAVMNSEVRVVVGTMHSVKGTTAGSVILCPVLSVYDHAWAPSVTRMLYVGMTRASERLTLLSDGGRSRNASAVAW